MLGIMGARRLEEEQPLPRLPPKRGHTYLAEWETGLPNMRRSGESV